MSPAGPCFEVGPKGYFSFRPEFSSTQTTTVLGTFSGFFERVAVFDRDGRKWRVAGIEAPVRKSWWRILLANTVHNPPVGVTLRWHSPGHYRIEELKQAYANAVDLDDDILTQFVDAAELKEKIATAPSFNALVEVYRWMETDPPDEETARGS